MNKTYSDKWGTDFASILKRLEANTKIGVVTGRVVGLSPFSISLLSGDIIINSNVQNIYVSETLTKERISCCSTCLNWRPTGSRDETCPSWEPLSVGDTVLVVPNETEKVFYIIDRMKKE